MRRLLMALWACLACLGIVTTPKTGLTQPRVQEFTTETVDDRETSFGDYWIVANRPHFTQVPPRRLSLARMENPLPWIHPESEGLITSPARILCANAETRSLWLTCKQADGSRHIVPFRSRCAGSPTIASLLGGRACQRPSIMTVEGRRVVLPERRFVEQPSPAPVAAPTAPPPLVADAPVARVEQPPTQAQAPPMVVAPREAKWPANALLLLAIAAIVMVILVGVIVHLYHGKKTAEASALAMQQSAQRRAQENRATLLTVQGAHEADRQRVRTKIAPVTFGLAARLKALEEKHRQAESHRDQLLGEVHTLNAQIRRLEQENAALREQAQPTAIVGDSEEVARLRHDLADAETRLTVLTGQVEELESRKMRDDTTLAETLVHLASVEDELEKEQAQKQDLLTQIQDLLTQIEELRIELEAHQDPTETRFPPQPSDPPPARPASDPPGHGPTALGVLREPTPVSSAHPGRGRRSTIPGPGGSPEPDDGFKSFDDEGPEEPTAVREAPPGTVPSVPPAQHISGVHPKPATGS